MCDPSTSASVMITILSYLKLSILKSLEPVPKAFIKVTKANKSIYIKDEKNLENYILETSNLSKNIKKGSPDYKKFIQEQRENLSIQRFKGLGEMNPEELWDTTLNPDNRTMLRVQYTKGTKDKSKDDQKMIEILMGDEVAPRKDFITNNALDVVNLDI